MRSWMLTLTVAPLLLLAAGCGGSNDTAQKATGTTKEQTGPSSLPQGSEPVELDPANFGAQIDNPYWPMTPGSKWVSRETDAEGAEMRVEVTVTNKTKKITGIDAVVVHDIVTEDGEVKEDTFDWYGQDKQGNIWYLGEDTKEYEKGKVVSTEGSWEHGVDGAQAGIIMPANPEVGMAFRQEYYAGEAEDEAVILSLDEQVEVPFGSFENCLQTEDTTPLDPKVVEHKFYAKGIGPVLALDKSGGGGREELLSYTKGS
jgi:hypothetical protein